MLKKVVSLSCSCKTIFLLRIMEDLSFEQTALMMGSFKARNCILLFTAKFMRTIIGGKNE
jgi:hypothetical protein